jgi:hypothetical protein
MKIMEDGRLTDVAPPDDKILLILFAIDGFSATQSTFIVLPPL